MNNGNKEKITKLLLPRDFEDYSCAGSGSIAFQVEAFKNRLAGENSALVFKRFIAGIKEDLEYNTNLEVQTLIELCIELVDIDDSREQDKQIDKITRVRLHLLEVCNDPGFIASVFNGKKFSILSLRCSNPPDEWPEIETVNQIPLKIPS